jgi:hypothetical protein
MFVKNPPAPLKKKGKKGGKDMVEKGPFQISLFISLLKRYHPFHKIS